MTINWNVLYSLLILTPFIGTYRVVAFGRCYFSSRPEFYLTIEIDTFTRYELRTLTLNKRIVFKIIINTYCSSQIN